MIKEFIRQTLLKEVVVHFLDEGGNTGSAASQCVHRILSDLLALEVKLEEEDKFLLLLSSLP